MSDTSMSRSGCRAPEKVAPKTRHTLPKRLHKTAYDTNWALPAYLSYRTPPLFGLSSVKRAAFVTSRLASVPAERIELRLREFHTDPSQSQRIAPGSESRCDQTERSSDHASGCPPRAKNREDGRHPDLRLAKSQGCYKEAVGGELH